MSVNKESSHMTNMKKDRENMWNSANTQNNTPSKIKNFIKTSTLKLLIPTLLASWTWISSVRNEQPESISGYENKNPEMVYDESFINKEPEGLIFNDLAAIKLSNISYRPSLTENELRDSKLIFDNGEYDENNISSISMDEELGFAPWTHVAQTISEDLYLNMFRKLSYEDYQEMFKWLKDLRQWTLGDCYVVTAIKNIARSKYFDVLMMTSIEKTGEDSYNLYMPLWEPKWVKVRITNKDLESAGVHGSIWYKILEVWFAKYLLFKKGIIPNTSVTMTDELIKKIESWSAWDAMLTLLWPKSFSNVRLTDDSKNKLTILNYLYSFDPKNLWSISVTSKIKKWKNDQKFYELWWQTIYYGHAYSVCGVEKEWDTIKYVILDNPWNTDKKVWWKKIKLKISDFLDCFTFVNFGKTTGNFLNYSTFPDEVKVVDAIDRKNS